MCTCEVAEEQVGLNLDLSLKEAAELAYRAQEGDTDCLLLLLEGIKEKNRDQDVDLLVYSAVREFIHLCSFYDELKADCIRRLIKKFREKA